MIVKSPVIVALDYPNEKQTLEFINKINPEQCRVKVGKELFTVCGPSIIETLQTKNFEVFLDMKFHDIPNTVARACSVAAELGVWMLNVHALGGCAMLRAARTAIDESTHKPLLIAVTVLTSLSDIELNELGITETAKQAVIRLAKLAAAEKLDGVVCSAKEVSLLAQEISSDFVLVTPGIRPEGSQTGDQKRVVTPQQAMASGSHYLVIGRPVTQAAEPEKALDRIIDSLS
ncbi:Orotidine 5'-phosphate decarboxylase [hydrothermal vent metagenome]|uniref:Orotidine 5'-phosphate decarboxylase n=1 Tax=hydrothermal vent metagenome TaxID=652676 RepID=A0A3B1ALV7_9ZZZZ